MKTSTVAHIKTLNFVAKDTATRISIREYLRNYKKYNEMVNATGEKIIITNQDEDVVVLMPVETRKKLRTFEEIRQKLTFKGGKNLSKNIDKIVYGL